MTLKSVVLPAPFGPRIARRSPCATSRSTSLHGLHAAEAPADPPQAEDRLGVRRRLVLRRVTAYLTTWFVMTPFLTTSRILPCHGSFFFTHGGCVRPGGGLVFLKRPPNDWSTFGT